MKQKAVLIIIILTLLAQAALLYSYVQEFRRHNHQLQINVHHASLQELTA